MYPSHQKSALHSYQRAQSSAMSVRQLEVLAFNRAASQLRRAGENVRDLGVYITALRFNQRLWTAIQARLMDDNSGVPEPVRTNLLNLSLFIDKQTLNAIHTPAAEKLRSLIEINLAMAGGLVDGESQSRSVN
jgi:flagellar biosynthesis activator protein FlaF